jgi:hypothetical protein
VLEQFPDRVFAFDEFDPLGIRPTVGSCWAEQGRPERHPATYHRTHGVRYFHGCYSVGDDSLWGVNRRKKGAKNTLSALRSVRAARPDGAPIYVILDNLSAHKGEMIRRWAKKTRVELCFTPTYASWANPIEPTSGHCGSSRSPTPTTATTPSRPGPCTPTCAGATLTPVTPTFSQPSAANAPASAARKASAGGTPTHNGSLTTPRPRPSGFVHENGQRFDSVSGGVRPCPPGEMFMSFNSAGLRPSSAVEHELKQTA